VADYNSRDQTREVVEDFCRRGTESSGELIDRLGAANDQAILTERFW